MSKRTVTQVQTSTSVGQAFQKASRSGAKRETIQDEIGEFEDAWEDEIEEELSVDSHDGAEEEDPNGMEVDEEVMPAIEEEDESDQGPPPTRVFIPGLHTLEKDEVLEADDSVYEMRHSMDVNCSSLSFDVLRDHLGDQRQRYPATAYIVAGTQADAAKDNELVVYKFSSMYRTQKDGRESDSDDEDEDADDLDEDAVVEFRTVPHFGSVNRVRAQPLPSTSSLPPVSQPYFVSTWAETGKVHIWDVRPLIESLNVPGYTPEKTRVNTPAFTITSHGRAEGFAMDWASSGGANLRLLTGDVQSKIYLTTTTPSGFNALSSPFTSHTSSVEDIQWSPSEPSMFASCSADQSVRVWDVRVKGRKSAAGIEKAHEKDVNVISWNKTTAYLLLSGGDEGGIKTWDLRNMKQRGMSVQTPVASLTWHKEPITSIEWHPTEDSIFAASSSDDQVTLWDLAVEHDDDEMNDGDKDARQVPPQLMFVHQGQKHVKEIHWHPQIPGAVISTAWDGFNIFKTISI